MDATEAIENRLAEIKPDESVCKTPPSEPWFSPEDLDFETGRFFYRYIKT